MDDSDGMDSPENLVEESVDAIAERLQRNYINRERSNIASTSEMAVQALPMLSGSGNNVGSGTASSAAARPPPPQATRHSTRRHWPRDGAPAIANVAHFAGAFDMFQTMQRDSKLCDVVLVAGPNAEDQPESEECSGAPDSRVEISAHKLVLSAASAYFYAMFTGDMAEARQTHVYLQDVAPEALSILVEYMYTGEVHITGDNVQSLLAAASLLQLTRVRDACCDFLKAQLHPSNCLGIRAFADIHACQDLLATANAFVEHHFTDLTQCDEFLSLSPSQLIELISNDRLTTPGEEKVFESLIAWVKHSPQSRETHLDTMMEHVRLPLMSQEYLVHRVHDEPLIKNSAQCKDYVIEAMRYHLLKNENKTEFISPRIKPRQPLGLPKLMMIIGGQAPKAVRNVDAYDFQTESWSHRSDLPQRRCRCGVVLLDGRVYAIGGFNGSLRVRTVDAYDPQRDQWLPAAAMEVRRSTLGVATLGHRIYAVGGFDGLQTCEAYDPRSGEWQLVDSMSTRRSSVGVAVIDGHLYAVGGYDGHTRFCLSTVERYEPRMDRWTPVPDMTTRRSGAAVCALGGKIFAVGGHDGPAVKRSAELYESDIGEWRPLGDMGCNRRNAAVQAVNGQLYVAGGDDGTSNLASVEVYAPQTNSWSVLAAPMPLGRSYAGVCVVDKLISAV